MWFFFWERYSGGGRWLEVEGIVFFVFLVSSRRVGFRRDRIIFFM